MKQTVKPEVGAEPLRADMAFSKLIRDIEDAISAGTLKPGDRLPSEAQLKQKYGISVNSIRRGIDSLVKQGILSRRQGSGTYVRAPEPVQKTNADATTILFATSVHHPPTHPFFGERDRALNARLASLGWKIEPFANGHHASAESQTVWHVLDTPELTRRLVADSRRIAGVVVDRMTVKATTEVLQGRVPAVCLSATPYCPFVDYDWPREIEEAFRLAVEAGARRIWAVTAISDDDIRGIAARVTAGNARASHPVDIRFTYIASLPVTTLMIETYQKATEILRQSHDKIDAMIMGSEFHAQAALDALGERQAGKTGDLRLIALINKESRIQTSLPFTALVADGAAAGTATADLLHQLITAPNGAPESIYLRSAVRLAHGWPRRIPTRDSSTPATT
jgi:DNA-binding transcriptional regulator YhcF (GntR family)